MIIIQLKKKLFRYFNTVYFKLSLIFYALFLLVLVIIVIYSIQERNNIRKRIYESDNIIVSALAEQLDDSLSSIDKTLLAFGQGYRDRISFLNSDNEVSRNILSKEIKEELTKVRNALKNVDGVFLFPADGLHTISSTGAYDHYEQEQLILRAIESRISQDTSNVLRSWFIIGVENSHYVTRVFYLSGYYMGIWVDVNRALSELNTKSIIGKNKVFFASLDEAPYTFDSDVLKSGVDLNQSNGNNYMAGSGDKIMIIRRQIKTGNFYLVTFIYDASIIEGFVEFQIIVLVIFALVFVVLIMVYFMIKKLFLLPIKKIVSSIRLLHDGNFDVRLNLDSSSEEFHIVQDAFNEMSVEIKNLKIGIYEEQINKQNAQIQFFKMQAKPHFFINSLNTIYNFAQLKDFENVQELTFCLAKHYRYILNSDDHVSINAEIEHIENYLRIQEIRFSKNLKVDISIAENVGDTLIPQFTIQTFVENAIKYTVGLDSDIQISIKCFQKEICGQSYIYISITDTGNGFNDVVLEMIQARKQYENEEGRHIGIFNLQNRLELMYKGKASLSFSNISPHGAAVEIELPMKISENLLEVFT